MFLELGTSAQAPEVEAVYYRRAVARDISLIWFEAHLLGDLGYGGIDDRDIGL